MDELGKEGAHEYRVKLGKHGGNTRQANLIAKQGEEGIHLECSRQAREGHENKVWLTLANSKEKLILSRCGRRTQNVPCLGDGSQVYLRAQTDTSGYSCTSCGSCLMINHNNLIPISEDVKFTYEEKKNQSLIRAKFYQLRDSADCNPATEAKVMVVVQCKTCSIGALVLRDKWEKRAEDRMSITCPGCKRGIL